MMIAHRLNRFSWYDITIPRSEHGRMAEHILATPCITCGALPGFYCRTPTGRERGAAKDSHVPRFQLAPDFLMEET